MPGYIISKEAVKDINDIWMYTAEKWSVEQADRYYNLIFDEIEYIVENFKFSRMVFATDARMLIEMIWMSRMGFFVSQRRRDAVLKITG